MTRTNTHYCVLRSATTPVIARPEGTKQSHIHGKTVAAGFSLRKYISGNRTSAGNELSMNLMTISSRILILATILFVFILTNYTAAWGAGTFSATGSMGTSRVYHTSTLLPNGKVLMGARQKSEGIIRFSLQHDFLSTIIVERKEVPHERCPRDSPAGSRNHPATGHPPTDATWFLVDPPHKVQ